MDLIIGAGAVGTSIAAFLIQAGRQVCLYVRPEKIELFNSQAITLNYVYNGKQTQVPSPKIVNKIDLTDVENIFIAVKHRSLPEVFALLPSQIPPNCTVVPCLNGVQIKEKFQAHFKNACITPITVMYNAQLLSPLQVHITTKPQLLANERVANIIKLFRPSDVQTRLGNDAQEWGKLLINLNNSICALTLTTFKDVLTDIYLRQIMAVLLDEASQVLDRAHISYRLPTAIPIPLQFYKFFLTKSRILPLLAGRILARVSEKSYPSMVADIQNNVLTEVDQINGELIKLANQHHLDMPVNRKIIALVKDLEKQQPKNFISPQALANLVL